MGGIKSLGGEKGKKNKANASSWELTRPGNGRPAGQTQRPPVPAGRGGERPLTCRSGTRTGCGRCCRAAPAAAPRPRRRPPRCSPAPAHRHPAARATSRPTPPPVPRGTRPPAAARAAPQPRRCGPPAPGPALAARRSPPRRQGRAAGRRAQDGGCATASPPAREGARAGRAGPRQLEEGGLAEGWWRGSCPGLEPPPPVQPAASSPKPELYRVKLKWLLLLQLLCLCNLVKNTI